MTLLLFQPPADNERGPSYLEGLIAGWVAMTGDAGLSLGLSERTNNGEENGATMDGENV